MKHVLTAVFCLFIMTNLFSQSTISGVFQSSEAERLYRGPLDWEVFKTKNDSMNRAGYRLTDLETRKEETNRKYWGIWIKSDQKSILEPIYGWGNFIKKKRQMAADSFLLMEIEAYAVSNEEHYFIGVWTKKDTKHKVWKLDSREGLAKKTEEMERQDFFVKDVEAFILPNKTVVFLALFHKGKVTTPRNYVYTSNDLKAFKISLLQRNKSGFRIVDFERFEEKGRPWYLGVFEKGDYKTVLLTRQEADRFNEKWEIMEKEGLKLMDREF